MTSLHEHFLEIAGPDAEPTAAQVHEDLARGRRALRRRNVLRQSAASVFAVAAVAAAVTYGVSAGAGAPAGQNTQAVRPAPADTGPAPETGAAQETGAPPEKGAAQETGAAKNTAGALTLVAYRGKQPTGFTIDKVPDGWEVQGVTATALTIAPIGFSDQFPDSFVGKIAVMLQSTDDHSTPKGTEVTVAGLPGVLNKPADENTETRNLWVKQKNGVWMQVQIWDASTWTRASIVEFAAGIHVLKDAQRGRG